MVTAKTKLGNVPRQISIPEEVDLIIRQQKTPFKHGDYSLIIIEAVLSKYAPHLLKKYIKGK